MIGDYIRSPKRILDEAYALQAERIVFWRNGEFRFPKIQVHFVVGLQQEYSWMLDQNALCFAIERSDISYLDLKGIKRPIYQPGINKVYEGGVKR